MTTIQTPVDALAAQARACAESLRLVSQTRRVQEACDVLEQCARALAAIPAEPDAQGERNAQMLIDIGNAALRAGWNGVDLQAFVIGRLASPSPSAVQPLSEAQVDAAAQKLAECMDYPWGHMLEQGRKSMREHAKAVIEAGIVTKEST